MARPKPLTRLEAILASDDSAAKKATRITTLAPDLPREAVDLLDRAMDAADPLVRVAMMDAQPAGSPRS